MLRKFAVAASAVAIATVGLGAIGAGSAGAAGPVLISCTSVKAQVVIDPPITLVPSVATTTITKGKLKGCTGQNLPDGVQIKGGSASGSIAPGNPSTCALADVGGVSESDITLTATWKTKPANALPPTTIVFSNRAGFTLPSLADGGTSTITGTGAGAHAKVVGDATSQIAKLIKACTPNAKTGLAKGIKKIKVPAGTLTMALNEIP